MGSGAWSETLGELARVRIQPAGQVHGQDRGGAAAERVQAALHLSFWSTHRTGWM
ncbi:hypothetical protein D3C71_1725390 [compost metagenome]